ncbi:MAG: cytochrome c biogenesis protein CcdA [Bacteroidales bacterium]|nr:cytochrome c biogenesis protein CcdA [Bacteroidales bacterium]MDY0140956.1 cytochrome c biogenesis protein CcdA [Bacteroidales bacterium]
MKFKQKLLMFTGILSFILLLNPVFAQVDEPVKWSFSTEQLDNDHVNLIIKAQIEDHWHLYGQYFGFGGPMPLYFDFNLDQNYEIIDSVIESPVPITEFDDVFEVEVNFFEHEATFTQKVKILSDKGFNITGIIDGQACFDDGACVPLSSDVIFQINGGAAIDNNQTSEMDAQTPVIVTDNKFENKNTNNNSLLSFFLISFLFGIIGILTPCVFPMIPMTVSFFMQKNEKRSKNIIKALIFGISITLLYALVGLIVSITSAGADFTTVLSSHWLPNAIFFVLFLVFAASLFGLFEFVLPTSLANKADKQVDKGGLIAAFFMALTTVIVSFSCTGPIIGALLVKAASGNVLEPLIGMLGFGLGFSLPFTLLALAPGMMKKLPKSGGWLNAVKVVMGFVILAFSLKYFSNIDQNYHLGILSRDLYIGIWITIFIMMGIYLLGKIKFSHDSDVQHVGFFRLILAMVSFVFAIYLFPGLFGANLSGIAGLLPPKSSQQFDLTRTDARTGENSLCEAPKYSETMQMAYNVNGYFDVMQGIECAKSQDKPVLLYFTGHTCSNCKKMQASIWSDPTINKYFNNKVVMTALYTDEKSVIVDEENWFKSSNDGKIKKTLGDVNLDIQVVNFKTKSQPFYVLMSPDGVVLNTPMEYNSDTDKFLEFLKEGIENYETIGAEE